MDKKRQLGFAESFLHEFYEKLNGGLVTVIMARLNYPLNLNKLQERINSAWYNYSLLHHHIYRTNNGDYIFAASKDEFIPKVTITEKPAKVLFEELLQHRCNTDKALWSVHYTEIPQPHLLLKIHHAIADGTAARALLIELITGKTLDDDKETRHQNLLPSVEELMEQSNETIEEPLPSQGDYPLWKFNKTALVNERVCRVELFEIQAESAISLAHNKGISVNAVFMAAAIIASKSLPGFPDRTSIILPVSVRNILAPPLKENEMGCYIGNAMVYSPVNMENMQFVDLARNLNHQLHHTMKSSITASARFSSGDIEASVVPFLDPERDRFGFNLAISNLGIQKAESDHIDSLWFGASVRPGHLGILISISTISNKFCIGLNYAEPLVERKAILKFKDALKQLFDKL